MRKQYETNIEIIMKNALKNDNIEFVMQYPIRCKYGYIVDFYLPEYNLIIECDGEVWHPKGNSHDKKRDKYLNDKGYIILRFKGEDIMNNIQRCIDDIIIQMKGGNIKCQKN